MPLFFVAAEGVQLQRALHFGRAELGLAIGLCYAASAFVVVPLGHVAAHLGSSLALRMSAGFSVVAMGTVALAANWWWLAVAVTLGGVGNAFAQIASNLSLADGVAQGRQGVAFAIKQAAGPVASLLAGVCVALFSGGSGWRVVFACASALALAAALWLPVLPTAEVPPPPRAGRRGTAVVGLLAAIGLLAGATGAALAAFAVDATVSQGLSQTAAGTLFAVSSIVTGAGRLGIGWVADRRHSKGLLETAALTALGAASLIVMSVAGDQAWLFVIGILGGFAGWAWPGVIYYATVQTQPSSQATGVVLAMVYAGGVAGPIGAGLLITHASYATAWAAGGATMILATVAALTAMTLVRRPA
jgi:MFS family permease